MTANSDIIADQTSHQEKKLPNQTTVPETGEDISPKKDNGVLKTILKSGSSTERPVDGETVYVHYVGTLLSDGSKFDSSRDRNEKFSFTLGRDVIKGWDIAVATMTIGECSRFIIKSEYGYGPVGSPPTIPPNATLVFEIELFDFHGDDISENKDKSILRSIKKQGEGYTTPNDGAICVVNLKGYDLKTKKPFDERYNLQFEIGEGASINIIEGIEYSLTKFKKLETSKLVIKSSRAWGSQGYPAFNIEPFTDVGYEVELLSFEKAKEAWQLNCTQKLEQSRLLKSKGSEFFKDAKYSSALKKYQKVLEYLKDEVFDTDAEKEEASKLKLASELNISMCHLKMKEYRQAIESCINILEIEPKNEKAIFRMGQGFSGLNEFKDAIHYYNLVLEVNPNNKEAIQQLNACKQKFKEYKDKEKSIYSKMFK